MDTTFRNNGTDEIEFPHRKHQHDSAQRSRNEVFLRHNADIFLQENIHILRTMNLISTVSGNRSLRFFCHLYGFAAQCSIPPLMIQFRQSKSGYKEGAEQSERQGIDGFIQSLPIIQIAERLNARHR